MATAPRWWLTVCAVTALTATGCGPGVDLKAGEGEVSWGEDAAAEEDSGSLVAGTTRLYRFYNSVIGHHYYSTRSTPPSPDFTLEAELIYAFRSAGDGRLALHWYAGANGDNFYSTRGSPTRVIPGYTYRGIACYVYTTPGNNRVRLHRFYSASAGNHFYTTLGNSVPGYVLEDEQLWVHDRLDYYGFYYKDYTAQSHAFGNLKTWTNTGVASSIEQARLLAGQGFAKILYRYKPQSFDGRSTDTASQFFTKQRTFLQSLRQQLSTAGLLARVTDFYIADEPALHRDIYKDQAFLNRYLDEHKAVFPDKRAWMVFAEILPSNPHLLPPPRLDVIMVDPYFWDQGLPVSGVRDYMYNHPNSSLGWALRFGKPVVVVGDAMIRLGMPLRTDLVAESFKVVRREPKVAGMMWFIYDTSFVDGSLRGAGTNPAFVDFIRTLRDKR